MRTLTSVLVGFLYGGSLFLLLAMAAPDSNATTEVVLGPVTVLTVERPAVVLERDEVEVIREAMS